MSDCSRKVALLAPHSQEHAIALPFQKLLADALRKKGVFVEESGSASRKRWAKIRNEFNPQSDVENRIFSELLNFLDIESRLKTFLALSGHYNMAVEIHGSHEECFGNSKWLQEVFMGLEKVPNANLLLGNNVVNRLVNEPLLGSEFAFFSQHVRPDFARSILEITQNNIRNPMKYYISIVDQIEKGKLITLAIEVPGVFGPLRKTNAYYSLYFDESGNPIKLGEFESNYCTLNAVSHSFSESEIMAAAQIVLVNLPA